MNNIFSEPRIRKNPLTGSYVIIAPKRSIRPKDIKEEKKDDNFLKEDKKEEDNNDINSTIIKINKKKIFVKKDCPFCINNISKQELLSEKLLTKNIFLHRAIKNKFPATSLLEKKYYDNFYKEENAYGKAEVIIEHPDHNKDIDDYTIAELKSLITFLGSRLKENYNDEKIKFVSLFKNYGPKGGASLKHSHTQLIAINFYPKDIKSELIRNYNFYIKHKTTLMEAIIKKELTEKKRIIFNKNIIAFNPFASEFSLEVLLTTKKKKENLSQLNDIEKEELAKLLKIIIRKIKLLTDSYNILYYNFKENSINHFYIRIFPRLSFRAGFEFITGVPIVSVIPSEATKFFLEK